MKKIKLLACSDSHGDNSQLLELVRRYPKQNYYVFCGDSNLDYDDELLAKYTRVRGNHDNETFPMEQTIATDQVKILVVHGQVWNVYENYDRLKEYMKANDYDICFHGHTHIPTFIKEDGLIFINPGSLMINRGSYGYGTYALVTIETDVEVKFYNNLTHQNVTKTVLADGLKLFKEIRAILAGSDI